jgi:hypothetical protein
LVQGDECGIASTTWTLSGATSGSGSTTGGATANVSGTYNVGVTTVSFLVTDIHGNTSTCSFTVTVIDDESPEITCPANVSISNDANQCNALVTIPALVQGDECGIASTTWTLSGATSGSGSTTGGATANVSGTYNVGVTTVSFLVTDIHNNTSTCSFTVTVIDDESPEITCPANVTVNNDLNQCNAVVNNLILAQADECGIASTSWTLSGVTSGSGSTTGGATANVSGTYNVGVTTVSFLVTDIHNNTSTCSFTVTVIDNQAPNAICQAVTTNLDALGQGSITVAQINNGSNDNCQVDTVTASQLSFDCSHVGANNVTLTVVDIHGNSSTCVAVVTVVDAVAPVAICQDVTVQLDATGNASVTAGMIDNGSDDACGVASLSVSPNTFNCSNVGANAVTLLVTDVNGNTSTCAAVVTVEENVPPVAICQNITVNLSSNGVANITASQVDNGSFDACGTVSLSVSPSSFNCTNQGANNVTLTVTDLSGNSSTCVAVVTVLDVVAPVAVCQNVTIQLDSTGFASITPQMVDGGSSDNCNTFTLGLDRTDFYCSELGQNTVTLKVEDPSLNFATCQVTVTVQDLILPTIVCPSNQVVAPNSGCQYLGSIGRPIVNDNCSIQSVGQSVTGGFNVGTTTVVWTVTDVANNSSSCQQTVQVIDTVAPVISCPANMTVTPNNGCNYVGSIDSPFASDECGLASLSNNAPFTLPAGTTTVVWTATDNNGNSSTCTQTIQVVDNLAPAIACPSTFTVNANTGCTYVGSVGTATATDNCGLGPITNNAPAAFPLGTTVVIWTVTDVSGNVSSCAQNVIVRDGTAPVVTCPGTQTINLGASCNATVPNYLPLGSASDNCGVVSYTQLPAAGTSVFGTGSFTVTLRATDAAGNATTCSFTVNKVDNIAPVVTCPSNRSINLNSSCQVTMPNYTGGNVASDNCGLASVVQSPAAGTVLNGVGTTTVILTATDLSGNTASCSFTVSTVDVTAPVIACAANIVQNVSCAPATITLTNPTATDACGGNVTIVRSYTGSTFPLGTTNVVWTATDQYGNSSTCVQTVTVTTPEIDVTGNGRSIASGTRNTSALNNTNFGSVSHCSGTITKTFVIRNTGTGALQLTGNPRVLITGANAADFTVIASPTATVLPGATASFTIEFNPSALGNRVAQVTIANNDCNEGSYQFAILGRGGSCNGNGSVAGGQDEVDVDPVLDAATTQAASAADEASNELDMNAIIVPNPNQGSFDLILNVQPNDQLDVMIVNEFGQVVHKVKIQSTETAFELHHLPAGLYYLQMVTDKERKTLRFVKL